MTRLRKMVFLLIAGTVMSCGSPPATHNAAPDPPELQAYIAEVRQSRMTDRARMDLRSIAFVITGGTLMSFPRDSTSGEYGRGYESTSCPRPGADSLAVLERQREVKSRTESMLPELRALADIDGSGFVTDREAWQLRDLIEFGYFVHYLTTTEHAGLDALAAATHLDADGLMNRVNKYNAAAARLPKCFGCDIPTLALK